MKRAPRRLLVAAVLLVAMLFTMALPAAAITGGSRTGTGTPTSA